jgi:hypothetical protein
MGVISFPVLAFNSDALRIVRRLSRQSSKTVQLLKKVHRDVTVVQLLTCVVDSSGCEEHIINPLHHRKEHIRAIKTEDSMKQISGSQRMKSGLTEASDQCLSIDW